MGMPVLTGRKKGISVEINSVSLTGFYSGMDNFPIEDKAKEAPLITKLLAGQYRKTRK